MTPPFPHTPGSWQAAPCPHGGDAYAVTAGPVRLADVHRAGLPPADPLEVQAAVNALLVAAAPDLAETLAALLDATDGLLVCHCSGRLYLAQERARTLLAGLACPEGAA